MYRILNYNIHHGVDLSGKDTLLEIGNLISDLAIDFCLLQEIDYANDRSLGVDQLQMLATYSALPFTAPAKIFPYRNGHYGTGILSSFPLLSNILIPLPILGSGEKEDTIGKLHKVEPRAIQQVSIQIPEANLTLLNTHFSMWPIERAEGFKQLTQYFKTSEPTILGGDFNTIIEGEYSALLPYQQELFPTFINPLPTQPIDRFFAKNLIVHNIFTLPVEFSDHLPIVLEFDFV